MYLPRRDLPSDGGSSSAVHFHSISSDDSRPSIDYHHQPVSSDGTIHSIHCPPNRVGHAAAHPSLRCDDGVVTSVPLARMPTSSSVGMLQPCASGGGGGGGGAGNEEASHRRQFSLNFGRSRPRYASSKSSNRDSSNRDSSEEEEEVEDVDYLSESDVAIATPCSDSSSNYVGGVMTDCESMSGTGRSRNDSESLFNRSSCAGSVAEVFPSGVAPDASVSSIDRVFDESTAAFDAEPTRKEANLAGVVASPVGRGADDSPHPPRSSSGISKNADSLPKESSSSPQKIDLVERVVDEILETEKNYVADLLETLRQYLDPMREAMRRNRLKLTEDECADLFGNLEQIYSFNRKFCLVLENCRNDPVEICKCFVKYRAGFDCYTYYCTNYSKSATVLAETNAVSKFVKNRQEVLNHGLPLTSYLLKPVQRILKYHLLLQALLDHYPTSRRGYGIVKLALETMTGIARHINETKRRRELDDKFEEIKDDLSAGWSGDLKGCGLLVLDGNFRIHGAKAMRSLFLFQKTLFVCKRKNERFEVKAVISCANLMIIESIPKEPLCFHILDYENPKNQFTVQTKSMEEKQKWSHHLKRLMLENHSTIIPARSEMILEKEADFAARPSKMKPPLSRTRTNEERGALRKSPSYQSAIELNHPCHSGAGSSKRIRKYRRKRRSRKSHGGVDDPGADDAMVKSNSLPNDSYLSKRNYSDPKENPVTAAAKTRQSQSQLCDSSDSEDSIINADLASPRKEDSSSESDEGSSYSGSDYLSDDFMTAVSYVMPEEIKPDWPWSQHFQNSSNIALRELRHKSHRHAADSSTLPHSLASGGGEIPAMAKRLSWSPKTEDDSGISDQNSKGTDSRKRDQRKGGHSYASLFSPLPYRTPAGQMSPSTNLFFNRKDMKSTAFHRQKSKELIPRRPVTIATDTLPSDSFDARAASGRYEEGRMARNRSYFQGFVDPFGKIDDEPNGSVITHFPSNSDQDFQTVSSPGYSESIPLVSTHLQVGGLHRGQSHYLINSKERESKNSERLAISLAKVCLQPGYPPEKSFITGVGRETGAPKSEVSTNQRGRYDLAETDNVWDCRSIKGTGENVVFCGCHPAEDGYHTRGSAYGMPLERSVSGSGTHRDAGRRITFGGRHEAQHCHRPCDPSQAHYVRPAPHPSRSKSLDPPKGEKSGKRPNRLSCGEERSAEDGISSSTSPRGSQNIRFRHKSESQPNFDYVTLIPESEMSKPFEIRNVYMVPANMTSRFNANKEHATSSGASWVTEMVSRFQRGLK